MENTGTADKGDYKPDVVKRILAAGRRAGKAAMVAAAVSGAPSPLGTSSVFAGNPPTSAEIPPHQLETLEGIRDRYTTEEAQILLARCAFLDQPAYVADRRKNGDTYEPDAAASCTVALDRVAHDEKLRTLYSNIAKEAGVAADPDQMALAILNAALDNHPNFTIGGYNLPLTSALAYDTGYTIATVNHDTSAAGTTNVDRLKQVRIECFDPPKGSKRTLASCALAGYEDAGNELRGNNQASR